LDFILRFLAVAELMEASLCSFGLMKTPEKAFQKNVNKFALSVDMVYFCMMKRVHRAHKHQKKK